MTYLRGNISYQTVPDDMLPDKFEFSSIILKQF